MRQYETGQNPEITASSGNVFADLELPEADDLLIKSNLAICIAKEIKARGLSQTEASKTLGIPQPKLSEIIRGKLDGFSIERLIRYSNLFAIRVKVVTSSERQDQDGFVTA